ncbi:MAG: phosphonate ABC transporter, permease protein PhnE [Lactobacillaceae bacterium]|jgi:phosphonate transport system permease protein|nr:phosphonate ABC transporter, permease protein PhnE [Lactobacillaceae bacterium]
MNTLPSRTFAQKYHLKFVFWLILIVFLLLISSNITESDLLAFFQGDSIQQFGVILGKMMKPDWSFFPRIWEPLLETIRMALVGTLVGSVIAVPVAMLSASNVTKPAVVRSITRFISNLIRTLPDLLLAAVFVAIFGFGPFAGILTLIIFSFGQMAKLLYEAIETIDKGPIDALETAGANKVQVIAFAIFPQVLNTFLSNFLYTFEVNIRSSTVIGYVGAGGIGMLLQTVIKMFRYDQAGVIILAILVIVVLIEFLSNYVRSKLT